jgi:class 3 adenylate cyclase
MEYDAALEQAITLLQREQRLSYRVLKRRLQLDDEMLEDLKEDLIYAKQLAVDEDGRVLVWVGDAATPLAPPPPAAQHAPQPAMLEGVVLHTAPPPAVPSTPDAERRQLTVLFCDLVDSTVLSAQLDPEDLRELVRAYQDTCAKVIARFEGHIAQYLGDGLLVYFGYPMAHEDDAQRAVRDGLGMVEALGQLNTRLRQERGVELAVRLGCHTGLVVVGDIGGGTRQEQLALGETPNLAARLQGIAAPNTVVISAATFQLLGGFFACQPLGTPLLKGFSQPLVVYRVLGESMARSRLDVVGSTGLTPLVGREQELRLLRERWAQVKDGLGQVVLLNGEAGIGKSRLVQVLKEHVASEPRAWLTPCQCLSYYQHSSLYPMIDLLERVALHFEREETSQQKLSKLEGFVVQYGLPLAEAVPLFAALLSLPLPTDYAPLTVSPEQQKQQTLHALLTIMLRIAAQQPVLFVMEDLHWIDPTTLEFLNLQVDQGPTARILALWTFRPDFSPPWTGALARDAGDAAAPATAPDSGDDGPGGPRQGPATRGAGAGDGQNRWGTSVCGGADQDGAGVGTAPGA